VAHRLSEEERQRILLTCNEPKYASLPPGQIVPDLADHGTLRSSVVTISEDALPPSAEYDYPNFPITLSLKNQMLNVKGKKFALQPGMALNAQIKLQKRTILQLLFSGFNQSLDSVRSVR
jgi:hypothetical protein